ncbi:MAG: response regulator [Desulfobacterales bacterium]|nr:response regulator [Desulfobacterales bacterium]
MALIVLADDDRDVREFVKDILEDRGDACLEFSNGDDALDALRAHPEAVMLISDISMPASDGRDVMQILRNGPPRFRTLPVILISGLVPEKTMEEQLKDRRCRFLKKPFLPNELYAVMDELLAGPE